MKVIGVTGGTGTGKTTAMNTLKKFGVFCLDADVVYHELLKTCEPMVQELYENYPDAVKDGELDRKVLGEIVFNDKVKLAQLNKVTHKYIGDEIEKQLAKAKKDGFKFAAIDGVEIIESGIADMCDTLVAITAPIKERIMRIMDREGISLGYAAMRIASQKPDTYYAEKCDIVIHNDFSDAESFENHCTDIFKNLLGV